MWRILYFAQLAGPQLGEKEGGGLPCPFFENKKKCPDFRKESPDCVHPYIKFTIQNAVLRVSKRKNFEKFPGEAFFTGSFDELFIGVP